MDRGRHLMRSIVTGLALSACLGLGAPLFCIGQNGDLQAQSRSTVETHVVEGGQTLYSISRMYGVTVDQVKEWNGLTSNNIRTGQVLRVSPPKPGPAASGPARAQGSQAQQQPQVPSSSRSQPQAQQQPQSQAQQTARAQSGSARRHIVSAGETLYSISRRYGLTVTDLQRLNSLSGTVLSIGQDLIVEDAQGPLTAASTAGGDGAASPTPSSGQTRVGQTGSNSSGVSPTPAPTALSTPAQDPSQRSPFNQDTSTDIGSDEVALKASLRDQLQTERGASTRTYIVRTGDTLSKISAASGMSVSEIRKLNALSGETLSVGQILYLSSAPTTPSLIKDAPASSIPQGAFIEYEVEANESISSIASRFVMTREELVALNPDIETLRSLDGITITVLLPPDRTFPNPYLRESLQQGYDQIAVRAYPPNAYAMATTSGELYNPKSFTGAHSTLPLGSIVYVENRVSGIGAFIRINDRQKGEGLMLSTGAYSFLGFESGAENQAVITTSM